MTALFWQASIIITIVLFFVLAIPTRKKLSSITKDKPELNRKIQKITPFSAGTLGATGWVLWTLVMLSGPLLMFQLGVIGVVLFACLIIWMIYRKKDDDSAKLKKEKILLQKHLYELSESYEFLKNERISNSVRWIKTPQHHRRILLKSLRNSTSRLIILSGWVTEMALDGEFRRLVLEALKRGVNVYIGYGYKQKKRGKVEATPIEQKNAKTTLLNLKEWCAKIEPKGRLEVWEYLNHGKLLLRDSAYVICGGYNWLSNSGGGFNAEISCGITDQEVVDELATTIITNFENRPPDRRRFLNKFIPWSDH